MPRNDDHKVARIKRHHYLAKNHIYLSIYRPIHMRSLSKYLCVYEGLYFRQSIKWMSWGGGNRKIAHHEHLQLVPHNPSKVGQGRHPATAGEASPTETAPERSARDAALATAGEITLTATSPAKSARDAAPPTAGEATPTATSPARTARGCRTDGKIPSNVHAPISTTQERQSRPAFSSRTEGYSLSGLCTLGRNQWESCEWPGHCSI